MNYKHCRFLFLLWPVLFLRHMLAPLIRFPLALFIRYRLATPSLLPAFTLQPFLTFRPVLSLLLVLYLPPALLLFPAQTDAQTQTSPTEGLKENTPAVHAFINATIVSSPGTVHHQATVVIRDGVIEAAGQDVTVPDDARVWDMEGKTLYPGFLDAHSGIGMQDPRK